MTFEFDLEVRPQFDLPQWKGLHINKPVKEFTDADVDRALTRICEQSRPAGAGRCPRQAGRLHHHEPHFQARRSGALQRQEEVIRLRPTLSFRDGKIEGFDKAMTGVKAGETRQLTMKHQRRRATTNRCAASK